MKKILILLFAVLMAALTATAQRPQTDEQENANDEDRRQTISGNIQDADLKEPLALASVQLFRSKDSTFVGG